MCLNDAGRMANSVDPDQTAPLGAVWSGSALFAQACLSENLGSLASKILSFPASIKGKKSVMQQRICVPIQKSLV